MRPEGFDELVRDMLEFSELFLLMELDGVVEPARRKRTAAKPAKADKPRKAPG